MSVRTAVLAAALLAAVSPTASAQVLQRFASLPGETFAPGLTSGQLIAPANGVVPPFDGRQPAQGFWSV